VDTLRSLQIRRAFLLLTVLAAAWAVAVALTGGFFLCIGPIRFSSRNPRNAVVVAVLAAVIVGALSWRPVDRRALLDDLRWLKSLGQWLKIISSRPGFRTLL
jgi:TRAP-type C4-dicarboxylate transport system permease large subunit